MKIARTSKTMGLLAQGQSHGANLKFFSIYYNTKPVKFDISALAHDSRLEYKIYEYPHC